MDPRIAEAMDLLRAAAACFPDSGAALRGAAIVAAALERARAGTVPQGEETSLAPATSGGDPALSSSQHV